MRILVIADIYDALAARRPYRDAMPIEKVFDVMLQESSVKLDPQCLEALMTGMNCATEPPSGLKELAQSQSYQNQNQPEPPA